MDTKRMNSSTLAAAGYHLQLDSRLKNWRGLETLGVLGALLDTLAWRPIAEAHEDYGECLYINVNDPRMLSVLHVCGTCYVQELELWGYTHFQRIYLSNDEAAALIAAMPEAGEGGGA